MNSSRAAGLSNASRPVAELCRAMNARDVDAIAAQLAPDAVWTIVGRPDRFAFGGPQTKPQFVQGLRGSLAAFDSFSFDVLSWARNEETVFVEARVVARGPGAAHYSNHYLMRFIVYDGLITEALEHYDPFEALAFVEQLSPA
jgi:ketosteroid isomerase-like protein